MPKNNDFILYNNKRYVRADEYEDVKVETKNDETLDVNDEKFFEKKIISLLEEILLILKEGGKK